MLECSNVANAERVTVLRFQVDLQQCQFVTKDILFEMLPFCLFYYLHCQFPS